MKLLYIVPKINGEGGVARVLSVKTNYLVEKFGYEVHIITQNNGNFPLFYDFNHKVKMCDISLKGNNISFFFQYKKALQNAVDKINPDIVIVCDNGLKAFLIPFILKTKIPVIFESHGSKFIKENATFNLFILNKLKLVFKEFSVNKFTKLVALSKENLREWKLKNGVVIPNPLWFESKKNANLKSKKVIVVARHSYEKGIDRLLFIWKKIIEKYPNWILEIYGKSSENQVYQKLAISLKIDKYIHFIEPVKNINEIYLESSFLIMTSRSEGLPMVLIEAMALGLPCVAYDCPCGPRSIIQNNENGFLVEDGNIDSFVQKMELLIEDENLRIQMGKNAKNSISKYDLETIMQQWKSLFEELIEK
jgi:glycosyltransferase involved in cell wall biosynthesis